MPKTFRCKNCGLQKETNYRLRNQLYCNDPKCQRVRRREYQRNRRQRDAAYRHSQAEHQRKWRKKVELAQYQRAYRASHPEYVERNRQLQRARNQKRRKSSDATDPMIVKMNSCSPVVSGLYVLTPYRLKQAANGIVKMNSFLVQLSVFHEHNSLPPLRPAGL